MIDLKNMRLTSLKNSSAARVFTACAIVFFSYEFYVWTKTETTDNAYVEADISLVSSQVGGVITKIFCTENQRVERDDILAEIDDTDYKSELDKAISAIDVATKNISIATQKIEIEKINIKKLEENLHFTQENYDVALREYKRTSTLASSNFSSGKLLDSAKIGSEKAKLELSQTALALESTIKNLALLKTQKTIDEANLNGLLQNKAIAENAYRNTKIRAAISGIITNVGIKTGNFVRVGQTLAAIVPTQSLYIKANFKETQVTKFDIGADAWVKFDGISGRTVKGYVKSISPAAGSKFSLIPPDNATGNFTKVVQRFPVIIDFTVPDDIVALVKTGMSASVSVRR
jgi:membrane fusion protein (multidrug efflux system)